MERSGMLAQAWCPHSFIRAFPSTTTTRYDALQSSKGPYTTYRMAKRKRRVVELDRRVYLSRRLFDCAEYVQSRHLADFLCKLKARLVVVAAEPHPGYDNIPVSIAARKHSGMYALVMGLYFPCQPAFSLTTITPGLTMSHPSLNTPVAAQ
ncbi:uncharacterized protein BO97DRAFT_51384 [Aspergillus homomorphus CBS 101889]|uniref:Uncharacterized protein n=1 Tax=Aspergillus homomorphus (strain CBS 101889) TaxID=1450537 RepID=A0A395HYJ8_ASPHC|nr:hypothetical protein BO97DRAFT_51384 [Aspergillus homomorphus CBS 101889]RAL12606.1 hypothetical protein BO97DRAFT_51384 [Aspergillus homomorphus CBS 101889]